MRLFKSFVYEFRRDPIRANSFPISYNFLVYRTPRKSGKVVDLLHYRRLDYTLIAGRTNLIS